MGLTFAHTPSPAALTAPRVTIGARADRVTDTLCDRLHALTTGYAAVRVEVWHAELAMDEAGPDAGLAFAHLNKAAAIADRLRREMDEIAWALSIAAGGVTL